MAMLRSSCRMALRVARPRLAGEERLSDYSAEGPFSHFSFRMRYNMCLRSITDPTLGDFFFEKWLHSWTCDVPSYNYYFIMTMALGACAGVLVRHWFFNPDIYGRRQELRKELPDRHRQWTYSLPFHNHQIRNCMTKYKHMLIDNEPDWADYHPIGYRPNRKASHRRGAMWCYTIPRYTIQDPLFTSVSYANMNRMYEEIGYQKKPYFLREEEDA